MPICEFNFPTGINFNVTADRSLDKNLFALVIANLHSVHAYIGVSEGREDRTPPHLFLPKYSYELVTTHPDHAFLVTRSEDGKDIVTREIKKKGDCATISGFDRNRNPKLFTLFTLLDHDSFILKAVKATHRERRTFTPRD